VYLLDTNACIAALIGRPATVRQRADAVIRSTNPLCVSTICVFELRYGAVKSARPAENEQSLDRFLAEMVEVLDFSAEDARAAGQIRADLERAGTPLGRWDYLIAGQAIRRNLILVTANSREFARVPFLRWENWAA
jgi:tRNA(fMet)-specific endonuclease VapC